MPMKTPFELEIVNDNDDNDNGDKVCTTLEKVGHLQIPVFSFRAGLWKKNRKNILYTVRGASTSVARFVLPAGKQVCRQSAQPSQQA